MKRVIIFTIFLLTVAGLCFAQGQNQKQKQNRNQAAIVSDISKSAVQSMEQADRDGAAIINDKNLSYQQKVLKLLELCEPSNIKSSNAGGSDLDAVLQREMEKGNRERMFRHADSVVFKTTPDVDNQEYMEAFLYLWDTLNARNGEDRKEKQKVISKMKNKYKDKGGYGKIFDSIDEYDDVRTFRKDSAIPVNKDIRDDFTNAFKQIKDYDRQISERDELIKEVGDICKDCIVKIKG